jgi:hypothetical protein
MRTSDAPLKVTADTKELVRYGAAVFSCTQGEFVELAVSEFLRERRAQVMQMIEERQAEAERIAAKHDKPAA